jgi:hypothetical protein
MDDCPLATTSNTRVYIGSDEGRYSVKQQDPMRFDVQGWRSERVDKDESLDNVSAISINASTYRRWQHRHSMHCDANGYGWRGQAMWMCV